MKHLLFWIVTGISFGILLNAQITLPVDYAAWLLLAVLPLLWIARGREVFVPIMVFVFVLLGFLFSYADQWRPSNAIEHWAFTPDTSNSHDEKISLEGIVKSQPEIKTRGKKITVSFVLASINLMKREDKDSIVLRNSRPLEKQVRHRSLYPTHGDVQVFLFNPGKIPRYGDRVRLWGHLTKARDTLNPGEFDYGAFLKKKGIYALFKAYGQSGLRIMGTGEAPLFLLSVQCIRSWMTDRLDILFPADKMQETNALLKALLLGKRKGLDYALRDNFLKTGTAHLLAISGLHIALIAGSFYSFLIFVRVGRKKSAFFAIALVFIHVMVAGAGIPVMRAGWMMGAGFLAMLLDRERNVMNGFYLAFLIIILTNTRALTDLSFQLSFLSVFCLIGILPHVPGHREWKDHLGRTLIIMAGTFPVVLFYFNVFSPIGLLANILAIPLFYLAILNGVLTLILGTVPWIGTICRTLTEFFLSCGVSWIRWLSGMEYGYFYLPSPSAVQLAGYYAILGFFLIIQYAPERFRSSLRACVLGLWLVFLSSFFLIRDSWAFQLTLLSAGKNEVGYIQTGKAHRFLINTGRGFPSDQGRWILNPFLRRIGVKKLTGVLMTDFYAKHWGGLKTLLQNFEFEYLFYPAGSLPQKHFASEDRAHQNLETHMLIEGDRIALAENGEIRVLGSVNGKLLVLCSYQEWDFLWVPDITQEVRNILKNQPDILRNTEVLVLPASKPNETGKMIRFLSQLIHEMDPLLVTLPGSDEVLKQYLSEHDIGLLELGRLGAVTWRTVGRDLEVVSFRENELGVLTYKNLVADFEPFA